jgi:hypothetical protein
MLFVLFFVEDTKHLFGSFISNPTLLLQDRDTMKWDSDKEANIKQQKNTLINASSEIQFRKLRKENCLCSYALSL